MYCTCAGIYEESPFAPENTDVLPKQDTIQPIDISIDTTP